MDCYAFSETGSSSTLISISVLAYVVFYIQIWWIFILTLWDLNKMAAILQANFANALSLQAIILTNTVLLSMAPLDKKLWIK